MPNGDDELAALKPLIQERSAAQNKQQYNEYRGDDITSDVKSGTKIGDYAKGHNVAIWNHKDLQNKRAAEQGILGALGNGVAQTIFAMPGRILAATGDMLDLPDYVRGTALGDIMGVDGEDGYGNFFSDWIRESALVKGVEDSFEVKQFADSGLRTNMGSYEWWRSATGALTDLAGSATEFAGAGMGIGALISKGLRTAGMVSKMGKAKQGLQTAEAAVSAQKGWNVSERLLTATALNQAESIGTAAELHQRIYNESIDSGLTGDEAAEKAAIAASTAMNMNRINIALNLTSVGAFGMGGFGTRQMLEGAKMAGKKKYAFEGAQEFMEEVVNFTAEKGGERAAEEGVNKGFWGSFGNLQDRAKSISENPGEALEAGILGMIGGIAQTGATSALASDRALATLDAVTGGLPAGLKKVLTAPLATEVVKFEDGLPVEKKDEEGKVIGYETERVSKAEAHKRRYERQQELKEEYEQTFGKETAAKMLDLHTSVGAQKQIMDEMVKAKESGNSKTYDQLRKTLLTEQAYQAFETGTTGVMIGAMEGEANRQISEEERIERGLPENYQANMKEGIETVKQLEKEYLASKGYHNSHAIYSAKAAELSSKQYKNKAKLELNQNKADFNTAVDEAIEDGRITVGNIKATGKHGDNEGDVLIKEESITDFLGGDYASLIEGSHAQLDEQQAAQMKTIVDQIGRLFPDEIAAVREMYEEVAANAAYEYQFKELYNKAKSAEVQKKARKAETEKKAKEKKEKEDEAKAEATKKEQNKQAAKVNKAKNLSKTKQAVEGIEELEREEKPAKKTQEWDMDEELEDDRTSTPRTGVDKGRSQTKVQNGLNITMPAKKIQKTKNSKETLNQQEEDTIQKHYDDLKAKLDASSNANKDPNLTDGDNDALAVFEAQRTLINALMAVDPDGTMPTWYDMVDNYVAQWGVEYVSREDIYSQLRGAYEMLSKTIIHDSFEDAYDMTAEELNQFNLAQDAEEEVVGENMYTNDTDNRVRDFNDDLDLGANYRGNAKNEHKTWTGHNIMGYLALDMEFDDADIRDQEDSIKENMGDPKLLHPDHYKVGHKMTMGMHPDPMRQTIVYKNKRMSFAAFEALIADEHGRATVKYLALYTANFPIQIKSGDIVVGYLHAESWINSKNVSDTKLLTINQQKKELRKMREEIMNGKPMRIQISKVTGGKPIFIKDAQDKAEYMTTNDALPGNDVGILVKTSTGLEGREGHGVDMDDLPEHVNKLPLGATVAMLPMKDGSYFPAALSMNTLSNNIADSINTAIKILTDTEGEYTSTAEELLAASGFDVRTMPGFMKYVKQFVYTLGEESFKDFGGRGTAQKLNGWTNMKGENNVFVHFDGEFMYMTRGYDMPLTDAHDDGPKMIKIGKNTKDVGQALPFIKEMLTTYVYTKTDADYVNGEGNVWMIGENGVTDIAEGDYNSYVKKNSMSNVAGLNIGTEEHPNYIYTVQPIIQFEKDSDEASLEENVPLNTEEALENGEITETEIEETILENITNKKTKTTSTTPVSQAEQQKKFDAADKARRDAFTQVIEMGKALDEGQDQLVAYVNLIARLEEELGGMHSAYLSDEEVATREKQLDIAKEEAKVLGIVIPRLESSLASAKLAHAAADKLTKIEREALTEANKAAREAKEGKTTTSTAATAEIHGIPKAHFDAAWSKVTGRNKEAGIKGVTKAWFVDQRKDRSKAGKAYAEKVYKALVQDGKIVLGPGNRAIHVNDFHAGVKQEAPIVTKTEVSSISAMVNEMGLTMAEQDQYDESVAMISAMRNNFKNVSMPAASKKALAELEETVERLGQKMQEHMGIEEDVDEDTDAGLDIDFDSLFGNIAGDDDTGISHDPRALEDYELSIITAPLSEILIDALTAGRQEAIVDTAVGMIVTNINNGNKSFTTGKAMKAIIDHITPVIAQQKAVLQQLEAVPDKSKTVMRKGQKVSVINMIEDAKKSIATLEAISENKHTLQKMITIRMGTINGTKVNQAGISEDDGTADRNKDQYDENASFTADSKKTVGANVRRFLSGIIDADMDSNGVITERRSWFGMAQFVNFNDVFNTVSKLLAGVEPSYESMIAVLKNNQVNFPWMQQLVEKLEAAKVKDDTGVVNEFITGMSKHEINMKYVWWSFDSEKKTYEAQVLNANSMALGRAIQEQWKDNLIRSKAVYEYNGKYYIDPDEAAKLIEEYDKILDYTGEASQGHKVGINDIMPQLDMLKISKVGDSGTLESVPPGHPLNTLTETTSYVGNKKSQFRITKNADGSFHIEYALPTTTPAYAIKKQMLQDWASKLGMDLADNTLNQLEEEGIMMSTKGGSRAKTKLSSLITRGRATSENNPFWHIYSQLKKSAKADASVKAIDDDGGFSSHKSIRALSQLQAKYEKQIFTTTFKAGSKNISRYTANKYITDRLRLLKSNVDHVTSLANISFSRHSMWMQDFTETKDGKIISKNNEDNPMKAEYVSLQALQKRGGKSGDEKSLMDIAPGEHEFYKLALFTNMKGGSYNGNRLVSFLYPTVPADKSSRFLIEYTAYDTELSQDGVANSVIQTFYDFVFQPEFQRIRKFQGEGIKTNVKEYDTGANLFHFLPMLNTIPELWNPDGTLKNIAADKNLMKIVKEVINTTIEDTVSQKIKYWEQFGLVETKEGKDDKPATKKLKYVDAGYVKHIKKKASAAGLDEVTAAAYDFEVNQMLATMNMFQMFIGDPAVFHKERAATTLAENEIKRHYAIQAWAEMNGAPIANYAQYYADNKDANDGWIHSYDNLNDAMTHGLTTLADAKYKLIQNKNQILLELAKFDEIRAQQLSNEMVIEVFNNVGKRLAADVAPGHDIPGAKDKSIRYLFLKDRESKSMNYEFYKSLKLTDLADYLKIEGADAQEYTTWQHHLGMLRDLGRISERKYNLLKKKIEAGHRLNPTLLKEVLQPVKPVYANNVVDEANDFDRRMFIKSSSFPLIPQLTKGLEIDKLRAKMEGDYKDSGNTSHDRAVFKTAVKVGAPSGLINIYDPQGNLRDDISDDEMIAGSLTLPMEGFKIQMDVPYKESKHKVGVGTQERKLMFTNLRGVDGFKWNGKTYTGAALEKEYNKLYDQLFKSGYNKLRAELTVDGELNKAKLQKVLKKEAEERGYPIADILGLEFDPATNDFILPIWANPSHKQFESLMISIVKNRIIKMKFEGGSFVMGSEEGFKTFREKDMTDAEYEAKVKAYVEKNESGISFTKEWQGKLYPGGKYWVNHDGSRRYTKDQYEKLPEDRKKVLTEKIMPAQVLLPSKIRGKDGHLMDMKNFVDPTTGMIDHKRVPKEILEFFHFRIPTQGHNSMSWAKVVGFLPPETGDLMIGSRDLTIQKGLDFDVDKEFAYFFHMNAEIKNQADIDAAQAELEAYYAEDGQVKTLQQAIKDVEARIGDKEWRPYSYKSDEARAATQAAIQQLENNGEISEGATAQVMEYYDHLTDDQLKALNERTYRDDRVQTGHQPLYTAYSGELADTLAVLKKGLSDGANESRAEHNQPFKDRANLKTNLRNVRTKDIKAAKDKLRDAKHAGTHLTKVGSGNSKTSVFIELDSIDPDTDEQRKVEIVTNDTGAILNKVDLMDFWPELEEYFDGDVEEEFMVKHQDTLKDKVAMNDILEIHKAVLMHEEAQKFIYAPLAFGDLKGSNGLDIAQWIYDSKNNRNRSTAAFTPLSSDFQRDKLTTGIGGRVGIGVLSLDSVFLSQAQGKGITLTEMIKTGEKDAEGKDIFEPRPIHVEFGDTQTDKDGDISGIYTNGTAHKDKKKYRFDTVAAYQSAAVDNENEQILDKINANKTTFPVVRAMALLGFDESLIALFLSQDGIVELVNTLVDNESDLIYDDRTEKAIIKDYEGDDVKHPKFNHRGYPPLVDNIGREELKKMIELGPEKYGPNYKAIQAGLMRKFLWLKEVGEGDMKTMQDVLKTDSGGLGENFMHISNNFKKFVKLLMNDKVENAKELIGDVVPVMGGEVEWLEKTQGGYVLIEGYGKQWWVRPDTIPAQAIVYGLKTANEMFDGMIPYDDLYEQFQKLMKKKLGIAEVTPKQMVRVFDEMKSFMFTHDNAKVIMSESFEKDFGDGKKGTFKSIQGYRKRLLTDVKVKGEYTHKSLATIISELKKNNIINNPFLNRLATRELKKAKVNMIEYNAAAQRGYDETAVYNGFADLLKKRVPLGTFNGKEYDTVMLAQDLIAYSYITGGNQGATNFVKYIPVSYLHHMGYGAGMRQSMKDMTTHQKDASGMMYKFFDQYIRNNPGAGVVVDTGLKSSKKEVLFVANRKKNIWKFNKGKENQGEYIAIRDGSTQTGFRLFKWNDGDGKKHYNEINTLGFNNVKEYDAMSKQFGLSTILTKYGGRATFHNKGTQVSSMDTYEWQTRYTEYPHTMVDRQERHVEYLDHILENTTDQYHHLMASFLMEQEELMDNTDILVDNTMNARGSHRQVGDESTIKFNEHLMGMGSAFNRERTIIHEYVHALTDKYLDMKDLSKLPKAKRDAIVNLKQMWMDFKDSIGTDAYNKMMHEYTHGGMSNAVKDFEYAAKSVNEFIAVALTSKKMQDHLKSIKSGRKTWWEHLVDKLTSFLKVLGFKDAEGTKLAELVEDFMTITEYDMVISEEIYEALEVDDDVEVQQTKAQAAELKNMADDIISEAMEDAKVLEEEKPDPTAGRLKLDLSDTDTGKPSDLSSNRDDDFDDDEDWNQDPVTNANELKEGVYKTFRKNKFQELGRKLAKQGLIEFDCK